MSTMNQVTQHAAALALALATGSAASAQVTEARLRVDGVACPFCAYNMEKRIKTLDGFAEKGKVETNLGTGVIVVPWSSNERFDPSAVRQAVKESGFTLRSIGVTASGTLPAEAAPAADMLELTDPGTGQVFRLSPAERADYAESWDALVAYASKQGAGARVSVDGVVVEDKTTGSQSWRIALERWAPTVFGAEVHMRIEGFACERCAARTMGALAELPDVIHVEADHEAGYARVWTTSTEPNLGALRQRIAELGFKATHMHAHGAGDEPHDMSAMTEK